MFGQQLICVKLFATTGCCDQVDACAFNFNTACANAPSRCCGGPALAAWPWPLAAQCMCGGIALPPPRAHRWHHTHTHKTFWAVAPAAVAPARCRAAPAHAPRPAAAGPARCTTHCHGRRRMASRIQRHSRRICARAIAPGGRPLRATSPITNAQRDSN